MGLRMNALTRRDTVVVALMNGRNALIEARRQHDIPRATQVFAQAEAFERWSRRQSLGEEWISLGHAVKIEALVVIGDLLTETESLGWAQ